MLELKDLPPYLRYVFLGDNNTFPITIAADLNHKYVNVLITVLKQFKKVIGWTIADITGILPRVCITKFN